jgi:hypothetical protein
MLVNVTSAKKDASSYEKTKEIELGKLEVRFEDASFKAGVKRRRN